MLAKLGQKLITALGGGAEVIRASAFGKLCEQLSSFYKVCDLFPYDAFDPKTKLFYAEGSVGFVIETAPLVGSSEEMQKEIANLFALSLPEGSSLQVMLWADPHIGDQLDHYVNARVNAKEAAARSSCANLDLLSTLHQLAIKRADYLKNFAHHSPLKPYGARNFRCFLSVTLKSGPSQRQDQETCERLKNQILTTLEMLGMPCSVWIAEDLLSALEGILNGRPDQLNTPKIPWNPFQRLSDQLSCGESNLLVAQNGLYLNDNTTTIRTYGVRTYPSFWSLHAMGELIGDESRDQAQIPCPFIIHYGVTIPSQDKPKTQLLAKTSYVEKQAYSPIGKYLPSIMAEADELGFVREALNTGERIVHTHFGVTLLAPEQEIDQAEQILLNLFTAKEWKLEENRYLHLPMFLSSLPMMWGQQKIKALLNLKKLKTTLSTESANLLPLQGEWKGTPTPGMILVGRRGQLFTWSPFDNTAGNYNVCVVGRSGSGKSVFMQDLMNSTLAIGGFVFVFDTGRSFEKPCLLLGGQHVAFNPKTPLCMNPFTTIPTDNPEVASDALAMLKTVLILMAAPSHGVDDKGAALLEQAMLEIWNSFKNESTISNIADWLQAYGTAKGDENAKDLSQMLFPYTKKGTYGRFFNGPSTVDLKNPLIVIELEELKERKDLQAVVVQMMIINITNEMFLGDRKTPFNIVFDEAWDMLRGSQSGVFIETLARRLRKYRGSLIVGTQSVNDFYQSPGAQAAFDNSDSMCMLSQKPESIDLLKKSERMSLSPQKEAQLKSLKTIQGKYAEVMIISPNGYSTGRFLPDPFSLLLYSTRPQDYAAVKSLTDQGMKVGQAIDRIVGTNQQGLTSQPLKKEGKYLC